MSETEVVASDADKSTTRRIGDVLVDAGVATPAAIDSALSRQSTTGKQIGQILIDLNEITERELAQAVATQLDIPFVDLRSEVPDQDALGRISDRTARKLNALPLRTDNESIEIVFSEPTLDSLAELKKETGLRIRARVAPATEVRRAIDSSYSALNSLDEIISKLGTTTAAISTRETIDLTSGDFADDAPVVNVVNVIILQALRDRASDIHIEPQDEQIRVRFRVDGALIDVTTLPTSVGPALVSRLKVLANMNIVEKRRPQDGQISTEIEGQPVDLRVSTTPTVWGEKAVLRVLDKSRTYLSLNNLGFSESTHELLSRLLKQPFGMVICAGPTGSGKTTTLYAALEEINRSERNIMTIEDPVEYVVPSINQIQINEQAGVTFANGLRSILRQDPDVILVGEIRDVETARIAVQSALTGHFVLSSLHATDAASAMQRFLDMGVESFLVTSSVSAIVGQRLMRRICSTCKVEYKPGSDELEFYNELDSNSKKKTFFKGEGCNFCAQTGYLGRVGVYEVLVVTDEVKRAILNNATADEVRELAISQAMRTLRHEAARLVDEDVTTIAEVLRTVYVM